MKSEIYRIVRYEADEGKCFDWREPRFVELVDIDGKPTGERKQEHLYVSILFIGANDSIDNYIEVAKPTE